jgi:hypothetical protein
MHLIDGEDRLIMERWTVVRIRDDPADIPAGIDGVDAGDLIRCADVDRFDAPMGYRAAEDLGVQHAGQPH